MNIRQKLLFAALMLAIIPTVVISIVVGYFSIENSRESLQQSAQENLIAVRNARKDAIETYFQGLENGLQSMSRNLMAINAMKEFSSSFKAIEDIDKNDNKRQTYTSLSNYYNQEFANEYKSRNVDEVTNITQMIDNLSPTGKYLQYQYISENSYPLGSKNFLNRSSDSSKYSQIHQKYHPFFRDYLDTYGLYDIFLVEPDSGNIIYSVFKELDYATSLKTGTFKNSGLASAFVKANLSEINSSQFIDYEPYIPSYNDQASFIAIPIFDNKIKIGILIYQAPINVINEIMTVEQNWKEKGLGESGETYLVGTDNLLRNDSRFLIEDSNNYISAIKNTDLSERTISEIIRKNTSIGLQSVDTVGTKDALNGLTGFNIFPDYREISVLSAYTSVSVFDKKWALMAEIDEAEAFKPASDLTQFIFTLILVSLTILIILSIFIVLRLVKSISEPIAELDNTVQKITDGDLDVRVNITTKDEFADLGSALNKLMDDKVSGLLEIEQKNEQLNNSIINLIKSLNVIADKDFSIKVPVSEDIIGTVAASLNTLTDETSEVLSNVKNISGQVKSLTNEVQDTSDEAYKSSSNERLQIIETINLINESSKEMTLISDDAGNANKLAETTIENTKRALVSVQESSSSINYIRETIFETEKRIKRLGDRSQEISGIVNLINNIAERTHILALNASMHAASAGEAGRGFAVVADEVQRLAENAKQSTDEISALVINIRTETLDTVNAMNNVITQVAEGTKLADKATEAMEETENSTSSLVALVNKITVNAKKQAQSSILVGHKGNAIDKQSKDTQDKLDIQKQTSEKLTLLSQKLTESVAVFKLQ